MISDYLPITDEMNTQTHAEPQATAGPWFDYPHSTDQIMVVGDGNDAVAHICLSGRHAVDVANARLIASAPELLAALKRAIGNHEIRGDIADRLGFPKPIGETWVSQARAAIAKAEGRTL